MRAIDITPGEYEVKTWRGLERITITEVKDFTRRVYPHGGTFRGHISTAKFAYDDVGETHPLQSVIRPWAEAAEQHDAKAVRARRRAQAISALNKQLPMGRVDEALDYQTHKPNGRIIITLSVENAEQLASMLDTPPETVANHP